MYSNQAISQKGLEDQLQGEGTSKMTANQKQIILERHPNGEEIVESLENHPHAEEIAEMVIEGLDDGDYKRDMKNGRELAILSPDNLRKLAEAGRISALIDDDADLKKDVATALKQFSPVDRNIIFRVIIQGESIDKASKGSVYTSRHWQYRFQNYILPRLRELLKDYNPELSRKAALQ